MYIYIVAELLMFALMLLSMKASVKQRNIFLLICCVLWALIFGLRGYNVGNDTSHYAGFFEKTNPAYGSYGTYEAPGETIEWGYVVINKFLGFFSGSATFLFLVHGFLLFIIIYNLYKGKASSLMSLIWLFSFGAMLTVMMVAMRQSLSVCFVLLSYIMIEKLQKKKLPQRRILLDKYFWLALCFFVFSITIHRSSIIFFPLLLLVGIIQLNKKLVYIVLIATFIVATLFRDVLSDMFDMGMLLIGGVEDDKIALLAGRYQEDMENAGASVVSMISLLAPIFVTTFLSSKDEVNTFPFKSLILGLVVFTLFSSSPVITRIVLVFLILGYSAAIPQAINKNKVACLFYILVTSYYLWRAFEHLSQDLANKSNTYILYQFVWQ